MCVVAAMRLVGATEESVPTQVSSDAVPVDADALTGATAVAAAHTMAVAVALRWRLEDRTAPRCQEHRPTPARLVDAMIPPHQAALTHHALMRSGDAQLVDATPSDVEAVAARHSGGLGAHHWEVATLADAQTVGLEPLQSIWQSLALHALPASCQWASAGRETTARGMRAPVERTSRGMSGMSEVVQAGDGEEAPALQAAVAAAVALSGP